MQEAENEIRPLSQALRDNETKQNELSAKRKEVEERKKKVHETLVRIERMRIRLGWS